MEVTYRRSVGKSFMVMTGICMMPDYQIEMCKRNQIDSFLDFETMIADGQMEYWYDITGKQSLEEYVKHKKLGYQEIRKLIAAIYAGVKVADNYLLKEQSILISPEYLYVSNHGGEVFLCYCPGEEVSFAGSLHTLMEYLLVYIEHGEEQAVAVGYKIYQMTLEDNCGIDKIWGLLGESENVELSDEEKMGSTVRVKQMKQGYEREEAVIDCVEEELAYENLNKKKSQESGKKGAGGFSEKLIKKGRQLLQAGRQTLQERHPYKLREKNQMVFEPMKESEREKERQTTFLDKNKEERKMAKLVYAGEEIDREIYLNKDIYCVGSQEDADIVLGSETVSRLHARINKADNIYYIEDLNSRNGTWVNGKLLHYMEKVPLQHGDVIAFADERFRYEE